MGRRWTLAVIAAALVMSAPAGATIKTRDMQLAARAVGFVDGVPRGLIDTAVVEGPGAARVMTEIGAGVTSSGVTLRPRLVSLGDLAASGVRVIIVPEGQGAAHRAIAAAGADLGAITVSTDMSCVRSHHCIVGVTTNPQSSIVVSRSAARAAGISFGHAFRVLIREI